jgi:hypothetical protein
VRQDNSADEQAFIDEWSQVADKCTSRSAQLGGHAQREVRRAAIPCYRLWLTFTVLWDGRVSLCCADFDGRNVLGDLRTSTIQEIWNSPLYRRPAASTSKPAALRSVVPAICRRKTRRSGSRS